MLDFRSVLPQKDPFDKPPFALCLADEFRLILVKEDFSGLPQQIGKQFGTNLGVLVTQCEGVTLSYVVLYPWTLHEFQKSCINWLVVSTPLKNISQIGNLPQIGVKIKNIWNHHPVIYNHKSSHRLTVSRYRSLYAVLPCLWEWKCWSH